MLITLNSVTPLYYVTFTTCTLVASFVLFKGFNTTDAVNTISLLCGFLTTFAGVYLLNLSREDPDGRSMMGGTNSQYDGPDGIPTDALGAVLTRRSMQSRRSSDRRRSHSGNLGSRISGEDTGLMHNYDVESANGDSGFGLGELSEGHDSDDGYPRKSFGSVTINGMAGSANGKVHVDRVRPSKGR